MLAELVDALWTTDLVSGQWRAGYIVNITKQGDKEDYGFHGGVTALNVVDNLYTKVINSRLLTWSDTHAGLHVCQAGSKQPRSCMDHVFSLSHIPLRTRQ